MSDDDKNGHLVVASAELPPIQQVDDSMLSSIWRAMLESGLIMSRIGKLAIPMMFSYTFSFGMVASSLMIPHLGDGDDAEDYLAAAPVVITSLQTTALLISSVLIAMGIEACKLRGELRRLADEDADEDVLQVRRLAMRDVFRSGQIFGVAATLIAMPIMFFSEPILHYVFHQDAAVAAIAGKYLQTYAFAWPGYTARILAELMLFAYSRTLTAAGIALPVFFLNNLLAMYLGFGPLKLGVRGIAAAYGIDAYSTAFWFSLFIMTQKDYTPLKLFSRKGWTTRVVSRLKDLLHTGLPITCFLGTNFVMGQILVLLAGLLGVDALSAQSFATQLLAFVMIPVIAFTQSTTDEVNRSVGKAKFADARNVARIGLLMAIMILFPVSLTFFIKPDWLIGLNTQQVLPLPVYSEAKQIIRLAAISLPLNIASYQMVQVLRVTNQRFIPTLIYMASTVLGLVLAVLLGFAAGEGVFGLQLGMTIGLMLNILALTPIWCRLTREDHYKNSVEQDSQVSYTSLMQGFLSDCSSFVKRKLWMDITPSQI